MLVNLEGLVVTLSRFFSLAAERTRRAVSLPCEMHLLYVSAKVEIIFQTCKGF